MRFRSSDRSAGLYGTSEARRFVTGVEVVVQAVKATAPGLDPGVRAPAYNESYWLTARGLL